MWVIHNKTLNKYWNSDKKLWDVKPNATSYNTYNLALKRINNIEIGKNYILEITHHFLI